MSRTTALARVRPLLRPAGRPIKRALGHFTALRLRWVYLRDDIDGVSIELRKLRTGHADVLRQFGASVAKDAMIAGPLSIVNARRDFSNLRIGSRTHIGSEVFFDLADRVTVEDGATISMRTIVISHFDAGRSALAQQRPRQSGPVTIAHDAYIGAGATILHGVTVGAAALVGAGAVVAKDVEPGAIVVVPSPRNLQQSAPAAE